MSGAVGLPGLGISALPAASQANLTDEIPATQGSSGAGTGTTRSITIAQLLALITYTNRNQARAQLQWANGAVAGNGTAYFVYSAPYSGTINSMDYLCTTGTFTAQVQINGTTVTGLGAVSVTGSGANVAATALNTFTAGQKITVVITNSTANPTNALLSLNLTWN